MKMQVRLYGFDPAKDTFTLAAKNADVVINKELIVFSDEAVQQLRKWVLGNMLNLAPKRRPDGNPPLVHTHNYIDSYRANVTGTLTRIGPTGMNAHMSNEELAEKLEHGDGNIPARPHIRPWEVWIERRLPILGERIQRGLFRRD